MTRLRTCFLMTLLGITVSLKAGDDFCGIRNTAFSAGESVTFSVYYTFAGVYVWGGDAVFSVGLEEMNGHSVYHAVGDGKTNSFFDGIFKVRDRYESYIDTGSLKPLKFIRNVDEGGYKVYENVSFNQTANTATTTKGLFKTPPCIQDVLSSIYYARNIDFDAYKPGDKIPFYMFLDSQTYNLYLRYMGKDIVNTRYGKFHAIKFKPLLIAGTMFKGGEGMTVWVSDDRNHLPLRIESPISVGSVKVDMTKYRSLRYRLSSLISVR
ncbi:DUF3108 domain-containing protein [Dinghuibacter silviterrae]|uniref:Uncharacterized protein DUF3108 n=1 Tax=Dinghuibacter silviterrae TaxID=1539049 RepID=A0A4R8DPX1_9BACT|nr:DUF3108 domain-containing protein [Dinghuibacter silviterrae]TDX00154.1 uncharacterized protein DUF3108 [Dinghuibacter silviterrae]